MSTQGVVNFLFGWEKYTIDPIINRVNAMKLSSFVALLWALTISFFVVCGVMTWAFIKWG